ncbi:MAG: hypothetical protein VYB32_04500 [Pseudomonadota bacterium]|nr:hypothetical protein [Pseudomonadota bacterium]
MTMASIEAPAGFVPALGVSFGAIGTGATPVDPDHPLPVTAVAWQGAATTAPVAGTASAATLAGPFAPARGRPIWLTLMGSWTGTVKLLRSTDGGTTRLPMTIGGSGWGSFQGNCNEPVAEESVAGATYYLDIAVTSGTLSYRVTQ